MSHYFEFAPIADGVWAALAKDPVWAMANAGFVDLGGQTLVFDAGFSPHAAKELRQAAEDLTQNRVVFLVNSHHHTDHVLGNQVFADAQIVAATETKTLMQKRLGRLAQELAQLPQAILQAKAQKPTSTWEEHLYALELAELEALLEMAPLLTPTPPNLGFNHTLEIQGSQRSVKIQSFGAGHTACDSVLLVDDVLFAGDLVLDQHLAFMAQGDPMAWQQRLADLAQLGFRQLVPGHGQVCTPSALATMQAHLFEMQEIAKNTTEISTAQPPLHWLNWGLPASFRANMQFLQTRT
jgi:cyclase